MKQFKKETKKLRQDRLILKADAKAMSKVAARSDIGKCDDDDDDDDDDD